MSLTRNVDLLRRLPKLDGLQWLRRIYRRSASAGAASPLVEITGFGDNPGRAQNVRLRAAATAARSALVVVLHGCGQTAASYDLGAGWSTLAKHYGFALLMPEQQARNNINTCFNWFNPEDTARDSGEASSIREMVAHMIEPIAKSIPGASSSRACRPAAA